MEVITESIESSAFEAADELLRLSKRPRTPLRVSFLQGRDANGDPIPGPLADFVTRHDLLALRLYLLVVTKASSFPWESALPSAAWARVMGFDLPTSKGAGSKVSKLWKRLEDRDLIYRRRFRRMAHVHLCKEDGSGERYELPAHAKDRYFTVPAALWTAGPDTAHRWYLTLTLPELAMLLIARSLGDDFRMPLNDVYDWYGISDDTALRGLQGLANHNLITVRQHYKKAPLSAVGYTAENRYTLQPPFGPKGRMQQRTGKK